MLVMGDMTARQRAPTGRFYAADERLGSCRHHAAGLFTTRDLTVGLGLPTVEDYVARRRRPDPVDQPDRSRRLCPASKLKMVMRSRVHPGCRLSVAAASYGAGCEWITPGSTARRWKLCEGTSVSRSSPIDAPPDSGKPEPPVWTYAYDELRLFSTRISAWAFDARSACRQGFRRDLVARS